MKYKYYITDKIKKWWNKRPLGPVYNDLLDSALKSSSPVKKADDLIHVQLTRATGKKGRPTLVWMSKTREDATVYVLRIAFSHDEYEKEIYGDKVQPWANKHKLSPDEEREVDLVLDDMLTVKVEPKKISPELTHEEIQFINGQLDINQKLFQDVIYETKIWVDFVQSKQNKQFDFYALAETIEKHIVNNTHSENGWQQEFFEDDSVIYLYHKDDTWILNAIYSINDSSIDHELLLQAPEPVEFRRGYPFSYLDNRDAWYYMELEKKSNMVLSEDQVKIVQKKVDYPMFITGRAGSGKSTILQYLFAEIILRFVSHRIVGSKILPPVYLSYSENLINDAKDLSQLLLEKNSCYRDMSKNLGISFDRDVKPVFNGMFFVFQDLEKDYIRKNDPLAIKNHFVDSKYISFADFKNKWNQRFKGSRDAQKKYGPSLSWHVIRTYIKGWDSTKLLTPADYAKIPRDSRSVNNSTFKLVYENVWQGWYAEMNDYWDDQDIVRYCLDNNFVEERFSGVFCDEAQDFTRVELEFILKISTFANRSLESVDDIKKLPFVFAGDEFQTLNPTGFSWSSLRGYFSERLCDLANLSNKKNEVKLSEPLELSENFRSTRQVVKIANHIQLLRATRFGTQSKPQSPHFSQDGNAVVCLSPNDKSVFAKLKSMDVVLLIPAPDGISVGEYIQNSPLKDMIDVVDGTPQGIIVLNPTQAKGLEYPNVAVYGFDCEGVNENLSVKSLCSWYANPIKSDETDIELKYQLSNAYVSVTRASNKLFIIDQFDKKSFWTFAYAHPQYNSLINNLKEQMIKSLNAEKRKLWDDDDVIGWIKEGNVNDITSENVDYLKQEANRLALEKRAESIRDAELMKQAACRNKEAGLILEENRCWAKSFLYDEQYLKAATYFEKAEMPAEAIDCYWIALCKNFGTHKIATSETGEIMGKIAILKAKNDNIKTRVCFYSRINIVQLRDFKLLLDELSSKLENEEIEEDELALWSYLVSNNLMGKIQANRKSALDLKVIVEQRDKLSDLGVSLDALRLANIAHEGKCTDIALQLWEEIEPEQRPDTYYVEKALRSDYPEMLKFYYESNLKEKGHKIFTAYRKHKEVPLTGEYKHIVSTCIWDVPGAEKERMKFLPYLFSISEDYNSARDLLYSCNLQEYKRVNTAIIFSILSFQFVFDDLSTEDRNNLLNTLRSIRFTEKIANDITDALCFVWKIRQTDFVKRAIGKSKANQDRIKILTRALHPYAQKIYTPLVVIEVGKVLEARHYYIEGTYYYDLVRDMYDDVEYKRMVDERNLLNLERAAEQDKNKSLKAKAAKLRTELQIDTDYAISSEPELFAKFWEKMYQEALDVETEIVSDKDDDRESSEQPESDSILEPEEEEIESEDSVEEESENEEDESNRPETESSVAEDPEEDSREEQTEADDVDSIFKTNREASTQKFTIHGYQITWIPKKLELDINYQKDDDNLMFRYAKGKMSFIGFEIKEDGRLYIEESEEPTPFYINIQEESICILVADDYKFTGMTLIFSKKE